MTKPQRIPSLKSSIIFYTSLSISIAIGGAIVLLMGYTHIYGLPTFLT